MKTATNCPAALNIKGEHFPCDWPSDTAGKHPGMAHANKDAQAIWTDDPQVLAEAWRKADTEGTR